MEMFSIPQCSSCVVGLYTSTVYTSTTGVILTSECESSSKTPLIVGVVIGIIGVLVGASGLIITCVTVKLR